MGYTTNFSGKFNLDKCLTIAQYNYLMAFSGTRRMARNEFAVDQMRDHKRQAVGLPVGVQGEFFVGNEANFGQDRDASVLDHNHPPSTQPGLWCQWEPTEDGMHIVWNGAEKFYNYVEWLEYIIANFLIPWGLTLNGSVKYQGEEIGDTGTIVVKDNVVVREDLAAQQETKLRELISKAVAKKITQRVVGTNRNKSLKNTQQVIADLCFEIVTEFLENK